MSKLQDVDRCVKCGHDAADENGICRASASTIEWEPCLCKCEFPSPSVSEAEDKNSVSPKPKALSHSSVVIPESVSLDADEPWRVLDLCQRALRSLPIDALGRDPQEGWFYRDELLSHVERVLRAIPITQDGASASALSTTAPAHGQASFIDSKSSESELVTVDEAARKAARRIKNLYRNASNTPDGELECATAEIIAAELSVHQPDANKVLSGFKCRICGSPLVLTHRNASLGQEYAVDETDPVYQAGAPSPVQPEEWVTCADCGQKRPMSSLESRNTFVCRYCLSTKAVQVDEVSKALKLAEYTSHMDHCEWWGSIPRTICTCGLADLLEGLDGKEQDNAKS